MIKDVASLLKKIKIQGIGITNSKNNKKTCKTLFFFSKLETRIRILLATTKWYNRNYAEGYADLKGWGRGAFTKIIEDATGIDITTWENRKYLPKRETEN